MSGQPAMATSPLVATHSGGFHADDVLATALLRVFWAPDLRVVRTRDPARLAEADLVLDVGAVFDPSTRRFDHHQATYTGDRSSAGLVLDWLEATEAVSSGEAAMLRTRLVTYVDDVDNGRRPPTPDVPCFAAVVDAYNQGVEGSEAFDARFLEAVGFATTLVSGLVSGWRAGQRARDTVAHAMEAAVARGGRVMHLAEYVKWKEPYFELGGASHPTEFVSFPGEDGSWRIIAIPPRLGDFSQKRSLPEAWAGLTDADLEAVTGIPGSVFCHKNRFIAVFATREALLAAIAVAGLDRAA